MKLLMAIGSFIRIHQIHFPYFLDINPIMARLAEIYKKLFEILKERYGRDEVLQIPEVKPQQQQVRGGCGCCSVF